MECGYGCLRKPDHPLPEISSGRNKLTVPLTGLTVLLPNEEGLPQGDEPPNISEAPSARSPRS
jgi:hypothetical protein